MTSYFRGKKLASVCLKMLSGEKRRNLTKSYDKSPYTNINVQHNNRKTSPKNLISQRSQTDLGRSDGVTTVIQLVWFTGFTGPNFPLTWFIKLLMACKNIWTVRNSRITTKRSLCGQYDGLIQNNGNKIVRLIT